MEIWNAFCLSGEKNYIYTFRTNHAIQIKKKKVYGLLYHS